MPAPCVSWVCWLPVGLVGDLRTLRCLLLFLCVSGRCHLPVQVEFVCPGLGHGDFTLLKHDVSPQSIKTVSKLKESSCCEKRVRVTRSATICNKRYTANLRASTICADFFASLICSRTAVPGKGILQQVLPWLLPKHGRLRVVPSMSGRNFLCWRRDPIPRTLQEQH